MFMRQRKPIKLIVVCVIAVTFLVSPRASADDKVTNSIWATNQSDSGEPLVMREGALKTPVEWRTTFYAGDNGQGAETENTVKLPIHPDLLNPNASTGKLVVPIKGKDNKPVKPTGIQALWNLIWILLGGLMTWLSSLPGKVIIGLILVIGFVCKVLRREPV